MPIEIDNLPVTFGQTLFFKKVSPAGNVNWKSGRVVDLNEHIKAVKLEIRSTNGSVRREWFPIANLVRAVPVEEKK